MLVKKSDIGDVQNLNGGLIDVIGHGGAGFNSVINPFATNSWKSITRAIDGQGADGVEVDVQLSKDEILMLYHDIALESLTDCDGCIREKNSGDLELCEYDHDFSAQNEKLIKLERVFSRYSSYNDPPHIYLDLRTDNQCDPTIDPFVVEMSDAVERIVKRFNSLEYTYIISGDVTLLALISSRLPGIKIYYSANNVTQALPIALSQDYFGLILDANKASKDDVANAHNFGIRVALFGMKSKSKIRENLKKHPDVVQTDNIPLTISLLK